MATPEEYDEVYRANPEKWTDYQRDDFAALSIECYHGQPDSLLDVGCGNGHTIDYLHMVWPDTKFSGLDTSSVARKLAKASAPFADIYNVGIDALGMKFEVITVMGVAEHFENIVSSLEDLKRHLKPGGILYIEVPNNLAISGRTEEGWFGSSLQTEWHLRRETWEAKIKEAGLKMVRSLIGPTVFCQFVWILERDAE